MDLAEAAPRKQETMEEYLHELKGVILLYDQETNAETKDKVHEACTTLIQLLPSNSVSVQLLILRIVTEVKNENSNTFKKLFLENRITFVLVDLLYLSNAKIKEYSYNLLRDLLKDREALALEDDTLKLVPRLVKVLAPDEKGDNDKVLVITKTQIYALQLVLLISFKKDSLILFKKCNVLEVLKPYLSIRNYLIMQKTCEILINMTYEETNVIEDFFELNLLKPLVAILLLDETTEPQVQDGVNVVSLQLCALCLFANLTRGSSDQNLVIVSSGLLEHLPLCLNSRDAKIRESAAAIISNLSRGSIYITDVILKQNFLPIICRVIEDKNEPLRVTTHLIKFLSNLAKGNDSQRKIIANYKIISVIEPILAELNSHEFDCSQIDPYSSIVDICLYVIVFNKYQKKFFFDMDILNLLFPILTLKHVNETMGSKERHLFLKKNFVKFLLLLSKNAREYNYEILVKCRVLEKLVLILNDVTTDSLDFGKSHSQLFDLLTIIYSISINCKQDATQKQILIQKFSLFKLLLDFSENKYNFKIRYISCELLTIMFKFDKELNSTSKNMVTFYKLIDDAVIEKIVNNFNQEDNGKEIDLQLISLISYIFLKDKNKATVIRWFDIMLRGDFMKKLLLFIRSISINNPNNHPTLVNIIIIFFSIFKLKNEKLITLISRKEIQSIMEFFKNVIGILTTKKDDASARTNELTIKTISEFASISPKEKQAVLNSGLLGILTLYLYSFASANHIKVLPLVLNTFAEIASGNEQQKSILCSKYNILPLVLSILNNNAELMNNIAVKQAALVVLNNLATNGGTKIHELIYKLGLSNDLIEILDEKQYNNEFKNQAVSILANLASGNEYQKEEQITQGVLLPVYDILQSLVKNNITPLTSTSSSFSSPQSMHSLSSTGNTSKIADLLLLNNALRLISNLSSGNTKQSLQIINSGYLPLLFELVSNINLMIVEKACRIIRNISNGGINHCRAIIANYLIIPLNSLLANNHKQLPLNNSSNNSPQSQDQSGVSDLESRRLKKSIDLNILWTFANISRFEDGEKLTVLNSGVLLTLPKVLSLTQINTKNDKSQQQAITSLLNNLIISKQCLSIIIYKHSELIVSIIYTLQEYIERRYGESTTGAAKDTSETDSGLNDLVVLLLNFVFLVSGVDDIKYRRFLIENHLLAVVNEFANSNTLVIKNLSREITNNLRGFERLRKKLPAYE